MLKWPRFKPTSSIGPGALLSLIVEGNNNRDNLMGNTGPTTSALANGEIEADIDFDKIRAKRLSPARQQLVDNGETLNKD